MGGGNKTGRGGMLKAPAIERFLLPDRTRLAVSRLDWDTAAGQRIVYTEYS